MKNAIDPKIFMELLTVGNEKFAEDVNHATRRLYLMRPYNNTFHRFIRYEEGNKE